MDMSFHKEQTLSSALDRHAISFESSSIDNTSSMIMMGDIYRMNSTSGIMFSGNSVSSSFTQVGNSCGTVLVDSVPGLKHDAGFAVEWSVDEQFKLEDGLSKYSDEPNIMKYIKIAATLHDKTVRDVALRCRWIARKRRKQDELNSGKKLKDKKDKLVGSSSKPGVPAILTSNAAPFSVTMNNGIRRDGIPFEVSGSIRHLLEQNNQVLEQISTNLCALKLQDNVELFSHMKDNLTSILNDMRYMPGPPLLVSLDENLTSILPTSSKKTMFGSSSRMHMKEEPGY